MSNPHPQVKIDWLSYKERRVDALALRADERRDKEISEWGNLAEKTSVVVW